MTNDAWQTWRNRLIHDWLKNQFLISQLRSFVARLATNNSDLIRLKEFASQDWVTWAAKRGELSKLLETAETALSPKQLLEQFPFTMYNTENKIYLSTLAHSLWLARSSIRQKIDEAKAAYADADTRYYSLDPILKIPDSLDTVLLRKSINEFQEFEGAVQRLSDCIHQLPHSIQVV